MKRNKKSTQEANGAKTENAALPAPVRRSGLDTGLLLPGILVATAGLVAACALLWLGLLAPSRQEEQAQLNLTLSSTQGTGLQQAIRQLNADTAAAAHNPILLQALQSQDGAKIRAAENSIQHWDGVIDAQINLRGQAVQNTSHAAPMNFSALDMLRRVEDGQTPPAEAHKIGQRWMIYSVAPLRTADDQPILGTVLLVVDLQRLLNGMPALPAAAGEVSLAQQFGNSAPQVLSVTGQAASAQVYPLETGNPNWKLTFRPGTAAGESPFSLALLALAALIALTGTLLGINLTLNRLHGRVRADARQLGQLLQELSGGKAVKAFSLSLPALDVLAQSMARLSMRKGPLNAAEIQPSAVPGLAKANEPASTRPGGKSGPAESMFTDTDILDIDILDEDQDFLGLEQPPAMNTFANPAPKLPASIFRAYDIRGVVGDTLTAEGAYWIGRAIGSQSISEGKSTISVGRDGRLSGPELVKQLIQGLMDCGCHVRDIGLVPTPALYFEANLQNGESGVMLTGSHNPPDYNGFKIVIAGDTLANEQIQRLYQRLQTNELAHGEGTVEEIDILPLYHDVIRKDIAMAKPLKVVVDCGNGAAGVIAPQLIESLGCKVIPLFCDVDGNFPNHHPDPGKPENLVDLIAAVKEHNADLGLAFDGDGDRVGVVTNLGNIVYPDRLLMLFAKDVVSRNPGADIIFDVKCTRRLVPLISGYGGRPVMWKTGHSLIKKKMKETGALLAGEMSGHIFFKERWYGFDDGIYSAARLLEILSQEKRTAEEIFDSFPNDVSTPEINIKVTDESKFSIIDALVGDAEWGEAKLSTLDGVRVDYPKGWGLVRASNTTPVLVLRFEADTEEELKRIQDVFHTQITKVAPDLKLPF